ncbi:hypothetical protein ACQKKX_20515 [Neorhizobium sp. NPDC001467]|uniref:hypothetical protein n=1 Tax=Neorhizobium sp. NPDC001467 TaxID=3390595 RepID=UPI003D015904
MSNNLLPITSRTFGPDTHAITSANHGAGACVVLDCVKRWLKLEISRSQFNFSTGQADVHVRLFYRDRFFRSLMVRSKIEDGRATELVLAKVVLCSSHRGQGHFKALLQGLERIAQESEADLVVEAANSKLSRILQQQNYLRCVDFENAPALLCGSPPGNWRYQPTSQSVMALIEMPAALMEIVRGRGLSGREYEAMRTICLDEVEAFQMRLAERISGIV